MDTITNTEMDELKEFWQRLESLEVGIKLNDGDLHESFLKWCSNLKHLAINGTALNGNNGWLHRHYPTIEHLAITDGQ